MTTIRENFEREENVFKGTILIPKTPNIIVHLLILRAATNIILLRHPNFTDYRDHTNPLCLIDIYYNYARQKQIKKHIKRLSKMKL